MMLCTLLEDYLSLNTDVRSLDTVRLMRLSVAHFSTYLGREATVVDLSDRHLSAYVRHRRERGRADSTIERELAKLFTLANFACREGYIAPLRIRPFKASIGVPVGFSQTELRRLFRAAKRYSADVAGVPGKIYMPAIVYVFWDTLERAGAVWSVERAEIDVSGWRGWMTFKHRKGRGRTLRRRLRWRTTRYVRKVLAAHQHDKVFSLGKHRTTLYYHWKQLLTRAGIPADRHHGPHCIRRTGGSTFQAAGGRAQDVLDHADERTTRNHYIVPEICREPQPTDRLRDPLGIWGRLLAVFGL